MSPIEADSVSCTRASKFVCDDEKTDLQAPRLSDKHNLAPGDADLGDRRAVGALDGVVKPRD